MGCHGQRFSEDALRSDNASLRFCHRPWGFYLLTYLDSECARGFVHTEHLLAPFRTYSAGFMYAAAG